MADTDRELLELAAKAAEIEGIWYNECIVFHYGEKPATWNPLTNDGDALRLAVKLRIHIPEATEWYFTDEEFEKDTYAATRRAIVRAAAEIGRAM